MMNHLRELASPSDRLYMKCIGQIDDKPIVQLFKRMDNNALLTINDTLALRPEIS